MFQDYDRRDGFKTSNDVVTHAILHALLPSWWQRSGLMRIRLGAAGHWERRSQRVSNLLIDLAIALPYRFDLHFRKDEGPGYIYQPNSTTQQTHLEVIFSPNLLNRTSLTMSLESGIYTITSNLENARVGRRVAENLDLSPKGIFKLPQDMAPDFTAHWQWEVEKLENGNYTLKAIGNIVGEIDRRLFAIFLKDEIAGATTTEWTLKRDERDTEGNAYVVLAAGRSDGWVAPASDDQQILVRPIIEGRSFPPTYLANEVFVFKKVD